MPERRVLRREQARLAQWARMLYESLFELLSWRPTTLLGYLVAVSLVSILLALALIFGVRFHILHRLR